MSYVGSAGANALGAPLSGLIVKLDGLAGLGGLRWLFVLEAGDLAGVRGARDMTDSPREAAWPPEENRKWLVARMETEKEAVDKQRTFTVVKPSSIPASCYSPCSCSSTRSTASR